MSIRDCEGWVTALGDQTVTFTGKVEIDGQRMFRAECEARAHRLGAATATDFSGRITLLVQGDLGGQTVTDPEREYSDKLVAVQRTRERREPHVHVVNSTGFTELVHGEVARCRRLRGAGRTLEVAPEIGDGVLGGRLTPRKLSQQDATGLSFDLSELDAGTAAHESTIEALIQHLERQGITALAPDRGAPRFDAGWVKKKRIFIAEVKSLRATNEDQQVRLGFGQVLDYAHQMPPHLSVTPVLVLERAPVSPRWAHLAQSIGVVMAHGPTFNGL